MRPPLSYEHNLSSCEIIVSSYITDVILCFILPINEWGWYHSPRLAQYPLDVLQACSFLTYIIDWKPMDDPVLSGVTQTCVTKLEGEVTIHVSIVLIHHLVFME